MHTEAHPQAGQTVTIKLVGHPQLVNDEYEYRIEDWWDRLTGSSWMHASTIGNPAAYMYAMRNTTSGLPADDDVVYGKIGQFGHLVHISEIQ